MADLLFITLCVPFTAADYASTSVWTFGYGHYCHQRCFTSIIIDVTNNQYDKHCHHHFCHICIAIYCSQSSTIIFKTTNTSINITTKVMKLMTIRRVLVSARPISDCCHRTRLHLYTCSYVSCKVIPSSSKFDGITFRAINKLRRIAFLRIALWKAIPRLAS